MNEKRVNEAFKKNDIHFCKEVIILIFLLIIIIIVIYTPKKKICTLFLPSDVAVYQDGAII